MRVASWSAAGSVSATPPSPEPMSLRRRNTSPEFHSATESGVADARDAPCISATADQNAAVSSIGRRLVRQFIFHSLFSGLLVALPSLAEEAKPASDPAAHTVVVPYDVKKPLSAQKPQRYYLDRESFERLWSLAKENRKPERESEESSLSIHSAAYKAAVEDERLLVNAKFEIGTHGKWTRAKLPVNSGDATIVVARDWMLDGKPVSLADGMLQIEKPGTHVVEAVIELKREAGWKEATLNLPAAMVSFVSLSVPSTDGRPSLDGVDLLTEEQISGQRIFSAVLGKADSLVITRSPRRPLADATLPASAETELIIGHTSGSAQSLLGTVRFDFPGTERTRFSLAVDANWQIAGWEVRQNASEVAVRHWSVREADSVGVPPSGGAQLSGAGDDTNGTPRAPEPHKGGTPTVRKRVIEFELDRPVADGVSVFIHGTRSGGAGSQRTPVLEPQATKGQQTIGLLHDETLRLVPQPTDDQRRIDKPAAMNANMSGGRGQTTALFFKTPAKQTLAYNVAVAPAKQEAHTDYVFQLSEQKQEMMAAVTLKSARDVWSQLRIALPTDFEIQSVDGPALASWKQEKNDLFLQFNPAASGTEARLLIYLAKSVVGTATDRLKAGLQQGTQQWKIEPLRFDGFEKIDGNALIVAHAATEARLVDFKTSAELQEADPTKATDVFAIMPPQEKKRAIKFERGDWKVNVSLAKQPVRFSSDGVVLAQATDVGLLVSQQVAFYVEQGALNRVTVKLPAALPEATVKGDALREVQTRVNGAVREYECSFQSDVLSRAALTFDMELPLAGELSLPFVDVVGAERLRRFFVLDNSSARESKTVEATGVESCAKNALPYVPDVLSQPSFYRGKSGAGVLKVAYEQLQSTEGNAAIVTLADITTAWRSDGERWDTVVYSVFNRSLQFLPVILPEKAELISVTVSGESVRADQETAKDGRVVRLIPLIQTRAGQRSLEVKLIYRMKRDGDAALKKSSNLRMDDPELVGISAERTVWTAIVPKQFAISDIDGNMEEVAEESKAVERLQGLMSDFNRLNKVLASGVHLSRGEGDYAIKEAEKLEKLIEQESSKVADASRRKSEFYYMEARKQDDEAKERVLTERAGKDLGDLRQELSKQKQMLSENRVAVPKMGKKAEQTLTLGNTWGFNNDAAPKGKEQAEMLNYGTPITANTVDALGAPTTVALNDNTVVQNGFLSQPSLIANSGFADVGKLAVQGSMAGYDKIAGESAGLIAGTAGVTVTKAGAGALAISGKNTYTGGATINAGTLTVSNAVGASGTLSLNGGSMVGMSDSSGGRVLNSELMGANEKTGRFQLPGSRLVQNEGSQMQASLANGQKVATNGNARANILNTAPQASAANASTIVNSTAFGGVVAGGGFGPTVSAPKPDGVNGLVEKPELLRPEDRKAMALTPPPVAAASADPFAAPATPSQMPKPSAEIARSVGAQPGFDAPQIPQSFGLEAQVANQLRATGRRSLMIDVPSDGVAYHFRKLKDHAVLELKLREAWTEEQKATAVWLGAGFAVWGLLTVIARRRRVA